MRSDPILACIVVFVGCLVLVATLGLFYFLITYFDLSKTSVDRRQIDECSEFSGEMCRRKQ